MIPVQPDLFSLQDIPQGLVPVEDETRYPIILTLKKLSPFDPSNFICTQPYNLRRQIIAVCERFECPYYLEFGIIPQCQLGCFPANIYLEK